MSSVSSSSLLNKIYLQLEPISPFSRVAVDLSLCGAVPDMVFAAEFGGFRCVLVAYWVFHSVNSAM